MGKVSRIVQASNGLLKDDVKKARIAYIRPVGGESMMQLGKERL